MGFEAVESFYLVDNDGVLLASPGDELRIYEPSGYNAFQRVLERDSLYYGINAEYGSGQSLLGFDWVKYPGEAYSPHYFLGYIWENIGVDSNVSLRKYVDGVLEYEWGLLFTPDSADEVDDVISLRVKKVDFGDKLRTRFDTKVDVESSTDLDDVSNPALSLKSMPLHSKALSLSVIADQAEYLGQPDPTSEGLEDFIFNMAWNDSETTRLSGTSSYWIPRRQESLNELPGYLPYNVDYITGGNTIYVPTLPVPPDLTVFIDRSTDWQTNSPIDMDWHIYQNLSLDAIIDFSFAVNFDTQIYRQLAVSAAYFIYEMRFVICTAGGEVLSDTFAAVRLIDEPADKDRFTVNLDYSASGVTIERGQKLFAYVKITFFGTDANLGVGITIEKINSVNLEIDAKTYASPSRCDGDLIYEVLNKSLCKAIGVDTQNLIESSFITRTATISYTPGGGILPIGNNIVTATGQGVIKSVGGGMIVLINLIGQIESSQSFSSRTQSGTIQGIGTVTAIEDFNYGYGALNFLTSGKKIRGITENANLSVSIKTIMEFLRTRYNVGWMIMEIDGQKKIVIEKSSYFFADVRALVLSNVQSPVKRTINKAMVFNEFESGYQKFAKENESSTINGFNTRKTQLTPIEREKEKIPMVAPVVADSAEIERVRRLTIRKDESDQSDDELVVIKSVEVSVMAGSLNNQRFNGLSVDLVGGGLGDDYIVINGIVLDGALDNISEISFRTATNQSALYGTLFTNRDISSVEYDYVNVTTTIYVDTGLPYYVTGRVFYSVRFDLPIYLPETTQNLSNISGVIDPESEYNIDHAPSNFLLAHWNTLGGGFKQKSGAKKIKFISGINNVNLSKRYVNSTETYTSSQIVENQDFLLSSLNLYNPPILRPWEWEVTCYLNNEDWHILRLSMLGQTGTVDFGYFEFDDNFGNLRQIYPIKATRDETSHKTVIVGWEKETPTPEVSSYWLQEDGSRIELEDGNYLLIET